VLRIFIALKNPSFSLGFEPATLGPLANTITITPPITKPTCIARFEGKWLFKQPILSEVRAVNIFHEIVLTNNDRPRDSPDKPFGVMNLMECNPTDRRQADKRHR
jgi:hypothetical protein